MTCDELMKPAPALIATKIGGGLHYWLNVRLVKYYVPPIKVYLSVSARSDYFIYSHPTFPATPTQFERLSRRLIG